MDIYGNLLAVLLISCHAMQQEWILAVTTEWLAILVRKVLCQMDVSGLLKNSMHTTPDLRRSRNSDRKTNRKQTARRTDAKNCKGSEDDIAFQKLHLMDLSKRGIGGCKRMTGQTQLKCEVHFLVVHLMTVCSCNPRRRKWCWQNWLVSPFWRQMCRWFAHCTGTIWGSVKPSWPKSLRCWSLFVLPAVLTTQGKLDVFFMMPC